jgi:hypothetical protein
MKNNLYIQEAKFQLGQTQRQPRQHIATRAAEANERTPMVVRQSKSLSKMNQILTRNHSQRQWEAINVPKEKDRQPRSLSTANYTSKMKEKPGISVHTCNARNLGG